MSYTKMIEELHASEWALMRTGPTLIPRWAGRFISWFEAWELFQERAGFTDYRQMIELPIGSVITNVKRLK